MKSLTFDQLLKMFDQIPGIIAFVGTDTLQYEFVNKAFETSFGLPRDKIIGSHIKDIIGEANFQFALGYIDKVRNGESVSYENTFNLTSGKRWIQVNYSPMFDAQGRVTTIAVLSNDITARKLAEEAIYANEVRFRQLADSTFEAIVIHDKGILLDVNASFCTMFGYDRSEVVGKPVMDLVAPESRDLVLRSIRTGYDKSYENGIVRKDGTVVAIETIARKIQHEGRTVRVTAMRDITERKKAEEEHLKYVQQLQQMQKLESLGILAGGIAHDFNNLMGGIYGYIDLANGETDKNSISTYLAKAMATIDRARALTRQLLTFAKGGAPIQKIGNLFPFVEETAKFALSGANVSCHFDVPQDLWACNFDKNQIGQVVDNLIINAQQAMPVGGTIELSALNISLSEKEHPLLIKGNYVKMSVKDCGIGIPKEYISKIFDPFFTTKARGQGLGLATCFSIIKRHGGCIDVESELGKGSTFKVYLPASSVSVLDASDKIIPMHKGTGCFLVMDDEEVMRETMRTILELFGYTVVCKENGHDAVDFFKSEMTENRTFIGMIFDLTVPGSKGGQAAVAEIRKLNTKIPVFVASGYADDPVMKNPVEFGFSASICKPFVIAELSEMLNNYLKPGS
jgi:two-component system, cell cycle sensor histidine kinase and response regulator CckA